MSGRADGDASQPGLEHRSPDGKPEGSDQEDLGAPQSPLAAFSLILPIAGLLLIAAELVEGATLRLARHGWGMVFAFIFSVAGVATGIIAVGRMGDGGRTVRSLRTARAGTLLSALLVLAMLLIPGWPWPWVKKQGGWGERAPGVQCLSNLRNICLGLSMYQEDFGGELPDTLVGAYLCMPVPEMFVCPNDPAPMLIVDTSLKASNDVEVPEGLRCSYYYVGRLSPKVDQRVILAYEKAGNHVHKVKGERIFDRNALIRDLHAEIMREEEFQALLRESLELVKQADWDSYSPERQAEIEAFYQDRPLR